jgi:hypothetical protein
MTQDRELNARSYAYVAFIAALGAAVSLYAATHSTVAHPIRAEVYSVAAVLGAIAKVRLPGKTGTVSLSFLFILLSNMELSLGETLMAGYASALVQSYWRKQEWPSWTQICFNLGNIALSIAAARVVYEWNWLFHLDGGSVFSIVAATAMYFLVNHFSVAMIIALSEGQDFSTVWKEWRVLTRPYNLAGAVLMVMLFHLNDQYGWACAVVVIPVLLFLYSFYCDYITIMRRSIVRAHGPASRPNGKAATNLRSTAARI